MTGGNVLRSKRTSRCERRGHLLKGNEGDEVGCNGGQLGPKQRHHTAHREVFGVDELFESIQRGEDGPKQSDPEENVEDDEVEVLSRRCSHQMALRRDAFHP